MIPQDPEFQFVLNSPFLYSVYDTTHSILVYIGVITDPTLSYPKDITLSPVIMEEVPNNDSSSYDNSSDFLNVEKEPEYPSPTSSPSPIHQTTTTSQTTTNPPASNPATNNYQQMPVVVIKRDRGMVSKEVIPLSDSPKTAKMSNPYQTRLEIGQVVKKHEEKKRLEEENKNKK